MNRKLRAINEKDNVQATVEVFKEDDFYYKYRRGDGSLAAGWNKMFLAVAAAIRELEVENPNCKIKVFILDMLVGVFIIHN